ncbi:calmodulin-binding protein [Streptomyces sp. NPDC005761]|uniref:BP74-related protein n=1 Tax=Streptomyces sp. NPDC005761 TaxID=3157066 RepID=UPI0033FDB267
MRHVLAKLGSIAAACALAFAAAPPSQAVILSEGTSRVAADAPAYFVMTDVTQKEFVLKLTEADDIEHARDLLSGKTSEKPHVLTRVLKREAYHNPGWSYQNDPERTEFFDVAIEVCDATIPYVEDHLDEAGGAFLPGLYWCDWTSRLIRELPAS